MLAAYVSLLLFNSCCENCPIQSTCIYVHVPSRERVVNGLSIKNLSPAQMREMRVHKTTYLFYFATASFEVTVNGKLIFSKLAQGSFPSFKEVGIS